MELVIPRSMEYFEDFVLWNLRWYVVVNESTSGTFLWSLIILMDADGSARWWDFVGCVRTKERILVR